MSKKKETDLLRKALTGRVWIRYGENEIQISSENGLKSKTVPVPSKFVTKVRDYLDDTRPMRPEGWSEIREYVEKVVSIAGEIELSTSPPKERELKIALIKAFLEGLLKEVEKKE